MIENKARLFVILLLSIPLVSYGQQNSISGNMAPIRGGTFNMGSFMDEPGRFIDEIPHKVTVGSFYMGKYPVMQREYREVMRINPSRFKGDTLPVGNVSWFDAVDYCNALSRLEGLESAYEIDGENVTWNRNADGYRLPTEAEWEYACRAGTTTLYNTGNSIIISQANYDNRIARPVPVGRYASNNWGLYDMHGNVWEWCWDWYGSYPIEAQTDPVGADSGNSRIHRGGCWINPVLSLRSAYRGCLTPDIALPYLGFRIARNAQ